MKRDKCSDFSYRTNIPKEVMQIPDFPFQIQEGPSFVHHSVIREYLLDYAKHFNLYPYIKVSSYYFNYTDYVCICECEHT